MVVQCSLCPKECLINPGQSGECRIRVNLDGKLVAVTYGHPCSAAVDPVEKKPLFHFLPGTGILSIATVGCNLHCKNCQNWQISQENPENARAMHLPPESVVRATVDSGCRSVAYTYTDPVVFYEYTLNSCIAAREAGLRNALVTAGYINPEPMARLCKYVDAANIDLKSMSDDFYRDICSGTLQPVLDTLVLAKSLGVLVEVTNLVIPTLNDKDEDITKLCRWIAANLGRETPLHFSRFHPQYRMKNLPPTPADTLDRAKAIGTAEGLHYVYIVNVPEHPGKHTYCPGCEELLIRRVGFSIEPVALKEGTCTGCGHEIPGVWQIADVRPATKLNLGHQR